MPITLFKKVTIHIDTTKHSEEKKTAKNKDARAIKASVKTQVASEQSQSQKYSRSSNNRRRNG